MDPSKLFRVLQLLSATLRGCAETTCELLYQVVCVIVIVDQRPSPSPCDPEPCFIRSRMSKTRLKSQAQARAKYARRLGKRK